MNTFPERLRAAMKEQGFTQSVLASKAEVTQGMISKWLAGAEPEIRQLKRLARALNVTTDYLLGLGFLAQLGEPFPPYPAGTQPMDADEVQAMSSTAAAGLGFDVSELPQPRIVMAESITPEAREALRLEDYRAVPLVEGSVAAGAARVVSEQIEGWAIVYQPSLGRRVNLVAVRICGDSMSPLLTDGSMVIIDRDDRRIRPGMAYLVRLDGGATVKCLELDGQELVLIPENHTHREQRIRLEDGQESPVAGVVVWSWRQWAAADDDAGQAGEKKARYRVGKK